jgi:Domain of unknown function (DUF4157)
MEARFGHDFSAVLVHADDRAAASAKALNARAYAVGNHVVIGANEPGLETNLGLHLLAHELAHVVQQRALGRSTIARQVSPTGGNPAPVAAISHYSETVLPGGLIEMRAWGRVGDPIARSGLEKKYPLPQDVGLPGYDRWHLAGPEAVGVEEGIAYAPKNFNVARTAEIENTIRRARIAVKEQGGEVFFDFTAVCRVVGDHEGVQIRVLEKVTWNVDARIAGADKLIPVVHTTAVPVQSPAPKLPASSPAATAKPVVSKAAPSATPTETVPTASTSHGPLEPPEGATHLPDVKPTGRVRAALNRIADHGAWAAVGLGQILLQAWLTQWLRRKNIKQGFEHLESPIRISIWLGMLARAQEHPEEPPGTRLFAYVTVDVEETYDFLGAFTGAEVHLSKVQITEKPLSSPLETTAVDLGVVHTYLTYAVPLQRSAIGSEPATRRSTQ